MEYNNLTIIGTSHIAKQSLEDVEKAIEEKKPDIIALELDRNRLYSLFNKPGKMRFHDIRKIGVKGFIFSVIGAWAEKKLGSMVGVAPGSEMKRAVVLAREKGIKIALIDQNIEITLKRFSKGLTWNEKWNFIEDILRGIFKRKNSLGFEFDLRKVPSKKVIKQLIEKVRQRYPNIYRVLIEERDIAMAENLKHVIGRNPGKKILAIVGAGHEEEIMGMIKKQKPGISYSFSVNL